MRLPRLLAAAPHELLRHVVLAVLVLLSLRLLLRGLLLLAGRGRRLLGLLGWVQVQGLLLGLGQFLRLLNN